MKPFAERNLALVGAAGLCLVAAAAFVAFNADKLPLVGGGTSYTADFGDSAGLNTGDDVSIAGVNVGTVQSIKLNGAHVAVGFTVKDAWVGNASQVSIQIKTTLGQEYLAIDSQGTGRQNPHKSIPRSRTTTPFDIASALGGLSDTAGQIDTGELAKSFDTLSDAFANTPPAVRSALTGLSRLSQTISAQDTQLASLAARTNQLSATLAANNANFASLINDGSQLLAALRARSQAITELLQGTRDLATQLAGLVQDDQQILGPALTQLDRVTDILNGNRANLQKALSLIGPYYGVLTDATGSGPWLDVYICGLFDATNTPILNSTAKRNCEPKAGS